MESLLICFTSIFVALDIIGTVPIYLSLTHGLSTEARNQIVNKSMAVAIGVALAFLFVGQSLFRHLGIELYDFRIAGGIILLLISLADLVGGPESVQKSTGSTGIVPLAVPLITGPGVLTTLLLQAGSVGYPLTILALAANYALAWFTLRHCENVTRVIGRDGTVVLSKIAALLLAAIAIAMIRIGAFDAFRNFSSG